MTGNLQFPDYLLIGAYIVLVIFVGMILKRSITGAKDYLPREHDAVVGRRGVHIHGLVQHDAVHHLLRDRLHLRAGGVHDHLGFRFDDADFGHADGAPLAAGARDDADGVHGTALQQVDLPLFVWAGFPLRLLDNGMRIYGITLVSIVAVFGLGMAQADRFSSGDILRGGVRAGVSFSFSTRFSAGSAR